MISSIIAAIRSSFGKLESLRAGTKLTCEMPPRAAAFVRASARVAFTAKSQRSRASSIRSVTHCPKSSTPTIVIQRAINEQGDTSRPRDPHQVYASACMDACSAV